MLKTIEEILNEIDVDLELNVDNISSKIYQIPKLHSKYLRYFYQYTNVYIKLDAQLKVLHRSKYHFYTFEFNKKLENAKEVEFHIVSDDEYAALLGRVTKAKNIVDVLDRTVKKVGNLSFDVKNILELQKYLAGV